MLAQGFVCQAIKPAAPSVFLDLAIPFIIFFHRVEKLDETRTLFVAQLLDRLGKFFDR